MITEAVQEFLLPFFKKWKTVIDFWIEPCRAPLSVYVRTIPGALIKPILILLSFSADDVARGALRPKGLYPTSHIRTKSGRKKNIGIPEFGEEIGKRIPGAEVIKARNYGVTERSLWLADGAMQRALYYVMLIDVATEFAYGWQSAIKKTGYCTQPRPQSLMGVNPWPEPGWYDNADYPLAPPTVFHYGFNFITSFGGHADMRITGLYRWSACWTIYNPYPTYMFFEYPYATTPPSRTYTRGIGLGAGEVGTVEIGGYSYCRHIHFQCVPLHGFLQGFRFRWFTVAGVKY